MKRRAKRLPVHRPIRAAGVVLVLLAILFAGVRLLTAWLLRDEVNGDLAIVQMMVRTMTTGGPIPAFFYGQAYMGSLEPVVNALFHLLGGRTNFGTGLGTVFFVALMACFVVRMACRAGGKWAAVAALAFCTAGPLPFAHYAVSPRGGYGVLLFAIAGLLDLGGQLICEERHEKRCRTSIAFAVGILAGLGLWCNQLAFAAVAAVALLAVLLSPRLLVRIRFWLGSAAGVGIGSAPFWAWNARNGWESFQMAGSIVPDPAVAAHNLRLLAAERLPAFFGVNAPYASRPLAAAVMAAVFLLAFLALRVFAPLPRRIHPDERPQPADAKVQTALCLAFLAVFAGCFIVSNFAAFETPRYLLPTVPALAVLAGAACASTRFRSANVLAGFLLALLCIWHVMQLHVLAARGRQDAIRMAGYREAAAYLEAQGTDVAYCAFRHNTLNLAGTGTIAFTDSNLERVPAFRRRAEMADSPAVVEDFLGIVRWAIASGGSACATNVGGLRLATNIAPPSSAVDEIPLDPSAASVNGGERLAPLLDRNYATAWELTGDSGMLEAMFQSPRPVCGVRMLVSGFDANARIRIWGRAGPGAPFRPLAPSVPNVASRWSGPRFYPEPETPILESRFAATSVDAVRIVFQAPVTDGTPRNVRELQLLAPASETPSLANPDDWHAAVDTLVDLLRRQGVDRLYTGRWIAAAVSEKTRGAIWTNHGQNLHPKTTGAPAQDRRPPPVVLDSSSALLVSPSGAPAMRATLKFCWLKMREVRVGALGVLFIPEAIQPVPEYIQNANGPWKGHTEIHFDPDCPTFLPSADWETFVLAHPPADPNARLPAGNPPTVPLLHHLLQQPLTDGEASSCRQDLGRLTEPTLGGEARFAHLHAWRGMRILNEDAPPVAGGTLRIRHYWSSPHDALPDGRQFRVVVHVVGPDGFRIQDGFALDVPADGPDTAGFGAPARFVSPKGLLLFGGSGPESSGIGSDVLWHVDRHIAIPADAPPGLYEMRVSLYDAVYSSRRMPVATRLPHRRKAVVVNPVFALGTEANPDATP